jgi:hypothetical protein
MKLSTKKKLGRKFASLLCISLIGVHLSQATYASDEIVYKWYTKDMRAAVNNVTKDDYEYAIDIFKETNMEYLTEHFEESDALYELGIETDTMSAHLLATGDTDSITDDNRYELAEDDWLIIYLHEKPGKTARILLDGE